MAEPNIAVIERQSVQVKPDAVKNPYGDNGFWSWIQTRHELLSSWGTRQRENELRLWDRHPQMWIWQGAVGGLTKKVASAPYEIRGGKNLVSYFDSVLRYAEFGEGWGDFIAKVLRDFLRHDNGAFIEIIAPGSPKRPPAGRVTGIAHLDSLRCYPTGDPEYPTMYYDRDGKMHLMHHTRIVHLVDMPDGDESRPGYGLCALSRGIAIATQELHMNRYVQSMLDDKPQPGYAITNNINEGQRLANFERFKQDMQKDELPAWGRVIWFPGLDPAAKPSIEFISFAQATPNWDYKIYTELHVNAWALALGIDVQELWQLTGGNIGSGQQSQILHAKSQGKTFGDLLTKLERAINTHILPDSLEFTFKRHDPYEAQERAQTAQVWAGVASAAQNNMTPDEKRVMLANMVEAIKDAITDDNGEIVRLPDQDVKPANQDQSIDDAAPEQTTPANERETTQDDANAKAVKAIQATQLDFEADWADMVAARRNGEMSSTRGDVVARALLAKYIGRAFDDGLSEGGVEERDDDDDADVLRLVATASGYVTDFNSSVETLSDAEAASKATQWYNGSIAPAFDAGRYSADRNGMYEFVGDDGEESCKTCKRLKGQQHRMKDWTRKRLRHGVDTENFECVSWNCKHKLVKSSVKANGYFLGYKGYPEYNPSQPRDSNGRWTSSPLALLAFPEDYARVRSEVREEYFYGESDKIDAVLSNDEMDALYAYTKSGRINDSLRAGESLTPSQQEQVALIDSAIQKYELDRDILVYRGLKGEVDGLEIGARISDAGYVSTSLRLDVARGFGNTQFRITLRRGLNVAFLGSDNTSSAVDLNEVLLSRNQVFQITNIDYDYYGMVVFAEAL